LFSITQQVSRVLYN